MSKIFDTKTVRGYEKLFSNQLFNRYLYDGKQGEYEEKLYQFLNISSKLSFPQDCFEGSPLHTIDEMASSPASVSFICFLSSILKPKLVIEIGTFIGFTTANLAATLETGAKLIAIEKFDEFAKIASNNIISCGVEDKVEIKIGDAKVLLPESNFQNNSVDLAFVDGNKEDYLSYVKIFENLLSNDGLMIIDDCFFHGDILNKQMKTDKGAGVAAAINYVTKSTGLKICFLPVSNGIALVRKS